MQVILNFCEICHFWYDDPFRHKTQQMFLQMVCTHLLVKFRHRTTRRFGGDRRQTK